MKRHNAEVKMGRAPTHTYDKCKVGPQRPGRGPSGRVAFLQKNRPLVQDKQNEPAVSFRGGKGKHHIWCLTGHCSVRQVK